MKKSHIKKSLLIVLDLLVIIFLVLLVKFKTPVSVFSQLAIAFSPGLTIPITAEAEYSLLGTPTSISINQTYNENGVYPLGGLSPIYGLSAYGRVTLLSEDSFVRIILVTDKGEKLVSEFYSLIYEDMQEEDFSICEETCALDAEVPKDLRIEINNATLRLDNLYIIDSLNKLSREVKGKGIGLYNKEIKIKQDKNKIKNINAMLAKKNQSWVAGETSISALSYTEKKKILKAIGVEGKESNFPLGIEYYVGGILQTGYPSATLNTTTSTTTTSTAPSVTSPYVDSWDWRNMHGVNWLTPVVTQGTCGSCWSFAAIGATEAIVNLYFNQQLNLDLSEQDVLSCSGGGSCSGGYPYRALDYIKNTGIVDEETFPYTTSNTSCTEKGSNPAEKIKISGRYDFGYSLFPKSEDVLKEMLITMGPLSSGLSNWAHAMTMVGYKVVNEGDSFYYRDLNLKRYWITVPADSPLIGKTVWIFKNSWGPKFGDGGYVYVETPITNINWTHGLKTPVVSSIKNYQVICEDKDGDGYYWWGLGVKPSTCPAGSSTLRDGDDSNPALGPLDQYGNPANLNNPPVANFSSNKTIVTEGETIAFSDLSINNPTSWSWKFEGGTPATSTSKNPVVSYSTQGVYDVTLTVTNATGSSTKTVADYISVGAIDTYGNLSISSNPIGATVYLNGVKKGSTKISLDGLKTGTYNLKLTKPPYQAYTSTITITAGQTLSINPTLRKKK